MEQGGRTRVSMRSVFPSAEACAAVKRFGAVEGGQQALARLAGRLAARTAGSTPSTATTGRLEKRAAILRAARGPGPAHSC